MIAFGVLQSFMLAPALQWVSSSCWTTASCTTIWPAPGAVAPLTTPPNHQCAPSITNPGVLTAQRSAAAQLVYMPAAALMLHCMGVFIRCLASLSDMICLVMGVCVC